MWLVDPLDNAGDDVVEEAVSLRAYLLELRHRDDVRESPPRDLPHVHRPDDIVR
jgi:hypothetical protein